MFQFFDQLIGYVQTAFGFLLNLIESLVTACDMLTQFLALPPVLTGLVPGVVGGSIILVSSIFVVKFIVGR